MWIENGVYGVGSFSPYWHFISMAEVEAAVRSYVQAYWACSGSDNASQVTVAIGVNNYGSMQISNPNSQDARRSAMYEFGKRFGNLVNSLNVWAVQNHYASQVYVAGANDIEWGGGSWNTYYVTRGWVDGFNDYDRGVHIYFNFGACAGCPTTINSTSRNWKYGDWTMDAIYYVSYGAAPAYTVPEIYLNTGINAAQWAAMSKFGAVYKGARIDYVGPMTQYLACQVRSGDTTCPQMDNTPQQGWQQLYDALNADPLTAQAVMRWVTDITWQVK
jgi:hypothetical protein